jgi:hypothetical protein
VTTRDYLLDIARSKLGDYRKGSPEVEAIWERVLEGTHSPAQLKQYADTKDWCGGYTLDCLRDAGLTDVLWRDGSGYVIRLLGYKSVTKSPKPGDIGIRVGPKLKPVYHHFIVTAWSGPDDWDSIDGNTPICEERHHTSLDPTIVFYSIDKLLPPVAAEPA